MATITYHLNGQHIDGWDEPNVASGPLTAADLDTAADALTDHRPGDVLTARVEDTQPGSAIMETRYERSLTLS